MSKDGRTRPSPGVIVAIVALLAVLASSATALPGKKIIDKNDLKKNVVKSSNVKNGTLTEADLVGEEQLHIVGAPGEPPFNNGGEGDCTWVDASSAIPTTFPVGFRKDRFGIVHMAGIAAGVENAGVGDEECGATMPEPNDSNEDLVAFTLPAEYRPEKSVAFAAGESTILVVGPVPLVAGPLSLAPGSVYVTNASFGAALDMVSFPTAEADTLAGAVAKPSGGVERLADSLPGLLGLGG